MYKLTQESMDWMFSAPPCRGMFKSGDGYCAIGKFAAAILGKECWDGLHIDQGSIVYMNPLTSAFIIEMQARMIKDDVKMSSFWNLNDVGPNLAQNHYRALKSLVEWGVSSKFLEVEDSLSQEFSRRICQEISK